MPLYIQYFRPKNINDVSELILCKCSVCRIYLMLEDNNYEKNQQELFQKVSRIG